jgi:hypothetical protein
LIEQPLEPDTLGAEKFLDIHGHHSQIDGGVLSNYRAPGENARFVPEIHGR